MIIGKVRTITDEWWKNVIIGVMTGKTNEVDYWTSGWTPGVENVDIIEVYYQGTRVISGRFKEAYKASPSIVHNNYITRPYSIGLDNTKNKLNDFEKLLKFPFKTVPDEIGNIVFEIQAVSDDIIKGFKERGYQISKNITPLEKKEWDNSKKLNSHIVYEEV